MEYIYIHNTIHLGWKFKYCCRNMFDNGALTDDSDNCLAYTDAIAIRTTFSKQVSIAPLLFSGGFKSFTLGYKPIIQFVYADPGHTSANSSEFFQAGISWPEQWYLFLWSGQW